MLIYRDEKDFMKLDHRLIVVYNDGKKVGAIEEDKDTYTGEIFYNISWYEEGNCWPRRFSAALSVIQAKQKFQEWWDKKGKETFTHTTPVKVLPISPSSEFFPTPSALAGKMLEMVDCRHHRVGAILEPSAGKGDLADALCKRLENVKDHWETPCYRGREESREVIDTIESDQNLQYMLKGKGYRIVGDDFLTFTTHKHYDLIIMNPPFSNGDEHLLRAIELLQDGGQIVCLLNTETIRNPYTTKRKVLKQKLAELNARIEFIKNAFIHAERPSDVEVAIVYIDVPTKKMESSIWKDLKQAQKINAGSSSPTAMTTGNWFEQMILNYNLEANAGVKLLKEYEALKPYIMSGKETYDKPLITVQVGSYDRDLAESINLYMEKLRYKYWKALLDRPELTGKMTSKMRDDWSSKISEMKDYDFSLFNVRQVLIEIDGQLREGVVDTVRELFHTLSDKYSYIDESSQNVHYYSGWKTNKAHKCGMKAIIPANGCYAESWTGKMFDEYKIFAILNDLDKALAFLDSGRTDFRISLNCAIDRAEWDKKKTITTTWYDATFYKKGTCHIKFNEDAKPLIDRLNIMVGREKNWLPPCYGKVAYDAMDDESRAVVDSFQSREEYEKVCLDSGYYLKSVGSDVPLLNVG